MPLWTLALIVHLMGRQGWRLLADAEAAAAHAMARLHLAGQGQIWADLSRSEWHHSASLAPIPGKLSPLDRPQGPDFAPGYSRLLCWRIWVGPPFNQLPRDRQLAIAAYFEIRQSIFYGHMARLSRGTLRSKYEAIAQEEEAHSGAFPLPCQRCLRREGWAIAALLLWDVPLILTGQFTYFQGK